MPIPLPQDVEELLTKLNAPKRLTMHLLIVHDVAATLADAFQQAWATLPLDKDLVRFGAATHDIGKVLHQNELYGHGSRHEEDGSNLLMDYGYTPEQSRFARTHGSWRTEPGLTVEDLLVALADTCWKGQRESELETMIAAMISHQLGVESWKIFMELDDVLNEITSKAEERLALQAGEE
ncbi:MAG: HD domain-containing protein [Planctomycetota bacterium]